MIFLIVVMISQDGCAMEKNHRSSKDLIPWCVVTYDSMARTPGERVSMLKGMGFNKYGYELRTGYPFNLEEEIELATANGLEITSIFLWLNAKRDSLENLSWFNNRIFEILANSKIKPALWLSMSHNFFEGLSEEQSMKTAIAYVRYIKKKAEDIGCPIALYNHHGWFGDPYNQVGIIESFSRNSLTMVYNFHHAHNYLNEFPEIVKRIIPYLSHVNISGVKISGPQILPVGVGDNEYSMMKQLLDGGYAGTWGILGHVEAEDVQKTLTRNIAGFNELMSAYEKASLQLKNEEVK